MHRLRDLDRRGRLVALLVTVALCAPFVASVVAARSVDWTPSNDEALITLRVHDVLTGEFPLIGQPSTAHLYADGEPPHHPGPIEFYLLAPVVQVLGSDLGVLVGAGLFNLSAVLVSAWAVFRRAGPGPALVASVAFTGVVWAQGLAVLTDPISSNLGGIPMLAVAVLAWAVVDGDVRLLPVAAFAFAFVAQQHLAVAGVAAGLGLWALFGTVLVVAAWRRGGRAGRTDRVGRGDPATGPASEPDDVAAEPVAGRPGVPTRPWPWIAGSVAVSMVAWLPVVLDQVWGSGNVGRMLEYARATDRPTLGLWSGLRQALRGLGAPPLILRTDLVGDDLRAQLSPVTIGASLLVVALLVAIVVADRRRVPARAALAATALVLAAFGAYAGMNVPFSLEANRINLYRWTFVVSALSWTAALWAAGDLVRRRLPADAATRLAPRAGVVGVAALLVASLLAVVASGPRERRDEEIFVAERELASAVTDAVDGQDRIFVIPSGLAGALAFAPSLALQLVEAGHRIGVPVRDEAGYGEHLVADPGTYDAGVIIVSGKARVAPGPGRVVARVDLNAEATRLRDELADQLRGQDLTVAPDGPSVLAAIAGSPTSERGRGVARLLDELAERPEASLRSRSVIQALSDAYFVDAAFDRSLVDGLLARPRVASWGEDIIEVRLLTPAEIDQHYAHLFAGSEP